MIPRRPVMLGGSLVGPATSIAACSASIASRVLPSSSAVWPSSRSTSTLSGCELARVAQRPRPRGRSAGAPGRSGRSRSRAQCRRLSACCALTGSCSPRPGAARSGRARSCRDRDRAAVRRLDQVGHAPARASRTRASMTGPAGAHDEYARHAHRGPRPRSQGTRRLRGDRAGTGANFCTLPHACAWPAAC